ncbi:MAG: response regulator, partial [Magnetococcales bacterium]|nr:response regulator [Magnetococcales bacterium]
PITLLVVDDDMRLAFSIARGLQSRVGNLLLASDGAMALRELAEHPEINAILMDVRMPHLDGKEAIRIIRAEPRHRPIVILAMTAHQEEVEPCRQAGADACLTKPVAIEQIGAAFAEVIATRMPHANDEPPA